MIEHRQKAVNDILDNWQVLSRGNKFHAMFATSSISDAVEYYKIFKSKKSDLKITALFDQTIDNNEGAILKEDGIVEILTDYNKVFKQRHAIPTYQKFKKDVALRLAHKRPYLNIENHREMQLDLLIVVNQMLTGFDSKWINTLYLIKF